MKKRLPTDLQILGRIYDRYEQTFIHDTAPRASNIFVPISINEVAAQPGTDPYILFGRLYHDLDGRYGYMKKDAHGDPVRVALFAPLAGQDKDCVNFPLLAGVVARLQEEDRKYRVGIRNSVIALVLSGVSLAVSITLLLVRLKASTGVP